MVRPLYIQSRSADHVVNECMIHSDSHLQQKHVLFFIRDHLEGFSWLNLYSSQLIIDQNCYPATVRGGSGIKQ